VKHSLGCAERPRFLVDLGEIDVLEIEARVFGTEGKRASTLEQYAEALRRAGRTTEAEAVRSRIPG